MHDFYTTRLSQVKSDRADPFESILYDRLVEHHKLAPFDIVVVWLFIGTPVYGTKNKVSDPPLCPIRLMKRRTDCPRGVVF